MPGPASGPNPSRVNLRQRAVHWALAAALVFGCVLAEQSWEQARQGTGGAATIPAREFGRMIKEFSEPGGFFRSDNLVSNETSYLHVAGLLKELGATGGAYIGVGPEQNFTYIAKTRPQVAFIVDIRRQAIIQHLMFKAIFHHSQTRTQFLSMLFSKPAAGSAPGAEATAPALVRYFAGAATDPGAYTRNLELIRKTITSDFQVGMDAQDRAMLERVFAAFHDENLNLQYRAGGFGGSRGFRGYAYGSRGYWGSFPTFADLVLATDLHGQLGNFLASRKDYEFVRGLQENNRIIPVVGDFSGPHALRAIGDYLRKNSYAVTVFYTSNVEQYLFSGQVFDAFAENVAMLPITQKSLFIRAYPNQRLPHPARLPGQRLTTLLQRMTTFLDDYRKGIYTDYWTLVRTHYIAAPDPRNPK